MGDITLNPNIASNTSNPASAVDNASTNANLSSIAPATSTSSSSTTPSADAANAWASAWANSSPLGSSNLSGADLSNVTPQTGVSLSGLSALAPATPAAPAAPAQPTLPANPTSADLQAAGYSLQSMDDGGDYGGPPVWVGPGGTFDQATIQQNDENAQAAADAAAEKAGNFKYMTFGEDSGGDYPTAGTRVAIPNATPGYSVPSTLSQNSIFQDVNSHSYGALNDLYSSINSGSYAIQGNTLYTGNGNQYNLQSTGTNNMYAVVVPTSVHGTYTIPIAADLSSGKAAMPDAFITTPQAITYTGGQSGSVLGGILNSLAPIAPILSLASLAVPELAPVAASLNTAEAANSGNVLGALASATGVPGVSDAVGSALGTTGSTVTNALKTANTANNLVNAVNSGNVTGALSAGASLTGVGSTPVSGDLPGSGVTVSDALKVANLANAVASGNQNAIINASTQVATSPTIQNAVNPAEGMGQIGTASGTISPASLNYPTDSTTTQVGALPTTDQTASADNTQTAGALPTSTDTTTASSSGFNTLDPSQIASVLNTDAVTAGQGTQTASAGSNLPQTSPPTGTTSATYPPDIGATWDAASGRWIDPSGNGYWTMNGSGGYTYTDYSSTTSQGDGTSVGDGTGTSGTGQGATENAPNTTSNVVDTSGALPSQPVDTNQISNTSPLQTVNASPTDTTGDQIGSNYNFTTGGSGEPALNAVLPTTSVDSSGNADYSLTPIETNNSTASGLDINPVGNIDSMGSGQGLTVQTPEDNTVNASTVSTSTSMPSLGDPNSFINQPAPNVDSSATTTPTSSTGTTSSTSSTVSKTSGALPTNSSSSTQKQNTTSDGTKFIDVKNPWLTVGKSQEQGIQENQLQQIYNSLDPNLKQALASKGIAPQTAASGGSIYGIEPELYKVMMSRMGYDDGGEVMTQTGNMFSDMAKTAKSMEPKFVRSDPHFLRPQNKNQSMQLGALTQLKQAPRLGGLAHGGLPSKYEENAPKGHNPEFITGITGYYAGGRGTGQSDDIPAMLHEGDHVADADVVAALGDGSSKAGKQVLDNFRQSIPHNDQSKGKPVPAMIADGEYVMPEAFVTALGQGDNKRGAQLLDIMREELRKHKRSAPDSKIPPKALSPLEYIHRGMKKSGAKK